MRRRAPSGATGPGVNQSRLGEEVRDGRVDRSTAAVTTAIAPGEGGAIEEVSRP